MASSYHREEFGLSSKHSWFEGWPLTAIVVALTAAKYGGALWALLS